MTPLSSEQALREAIAALMRRDGVETDPEGIIVKGYEVTDPAGHAAEVLADLEAAER